MNDRRTVHETVSFTLVAGSLLLLASLSACSTSHSAADAGGRDAVVDHAMDDADTDAGDDDADDAAEDAPADSGDTGTIVSSQEAGSQRCASRADCSSGICCVDLGVGLPIAECKAPDDCSGTEICGVTSKGTCSSGKCTAYECSVGVPARMTVIYACEEPTGITCELAPDAGAPEPDSGS